MAKKINFVNWIFIVVVSIIIIQAIALLLGSWFEEAAMIKLGPSIVLLSIAAAVMIPFVILKREVEQKPFDKRDVLLILVTIVVITILILKIKVLVPDAFEAAVHQMQAALGLT